MYSSLNGVISFAVLKEMGKAEGGGCTKGKVPEGMVDGRGKEGAGCKSALGPRDQVV